MDWVGVLIERVSGLSLEECFQKNVLRPLGIESVSFFPSNKTLADLAYLHRRNEDGRLTQVDHLYRAPLLRRLDNETSTRFCAGGHGCFGKPGELRSK